MFLKHPALCAKQHFVVCATGLLLTLACSCNKVEQVDPSHDGRSVDGSDGRAKQPDSADESSPIKRKNVFDRDDSARNQEFIVKPRLAVVIDCSWSMAIEDVYSQDELAQLNPVTAQSGAVSRLNLAKSLLLTDDGKALKQLVEKYRVVIYRGGDKLERVATVEKNNDVAGVIAALQKLKPTGEETRLGENLQHLVRVEQGTPLLSGALTVLLLSDGLITGGPPPREANQLLSAKNVTTYVLAFGRNGGERSADSTHARNSTDVGKKLMAVLMLDREKYDKGDRVRADVIVKSQNIRRPLRLVIYAAGEQWKVITDLRHYPLENEQRNRLLASFIATEAGRFSVRVEDDRGRRLSAEKRFEIVPPADGTDRGQTFNHQLLRALAESAKGSFHAVSPSSWEELVEAIVRDAPKAKNVTIPSVPE